MMEATRDADRVTRISGLAGTLAGLALIGMVLVMAAVVLMRAVFGLAPPAIGDLAVYLHAVAILVGLPVALMRNAHVRIALGSAAQTAGQRGRWIDILGHLLLTLPFAILLVVTAWPYALRSWSTGEGATDPGGLGLVYVIKFMIVLSGALVAAAALSLAFRSLRASRALRVRH